MFNSLDNIISTSVRESGKHVLIGDMVAPYSTFESVNLFNRRGFRATPNETGIYDSVWLVQEPVTCQGWRILLDSCIRMLTEHGTLNIRYVQNKYISIPALKNFLFRKYGLTVTLENEIISDGECFSSFKIVRHNKKLIESKLWSFGILTQGGKVGIVKRLCETIRKYGGESHQIIICGPQNDAYESFSPEYIDKAYSKVFAEICVKKNDIINLAMHDNICILHDRYWLGSDFFSGFEQFGYDFDFVTVQQYHESGKNYPSYCAIDDKLNLIWGNIYECGNENEQWNQHYLNGGLIIAKKDVLKKIPFNELIFHNQAEDVEIARHMSFFSIIPRINRFSSAITDVEDHLTNAFTFAEHSDYENTFFNKAENVSNASKIDNDIMDVNPRPWGKFQEIFEKIEVYRKQGGSWSQIVFLGIRYLGLKGLKKIKSIKVKLQNLTGRFEKSSGVNIIFYLGSDGVSSLTIHYIQSLLKKNIPVSIIDLNKGKYLSSLPKEWVKFIRDEPTYPTNIWCMGFPFIQRHLTVLESWAVSRNNINFTHWELPYIPERLRANLEFVDSFIVDSEFVFEALKDATSKPIELIDIEINIALDNIEKYNREYFGLPENKILFLLNWEFTSSTLRKNPNAALEAFTLAFSDDDNAALVMHVKFDQRHGEPLQSDYHAFILDIKNKYPNVIIMQQYNFSYEESLGLKRACDIYVSTHRSEGYGMCCAEALTLQRRCVMTGWSGNMEFCKRKGWSSLIYLIDYDLVTVKPEDFFWVETGDEVQQFWANVKVEHASKMLYKAYLDSIKEISRKNIRLFEQDIGVLS